MNMNFIGIALILSAASILSGCSAGAASSPSPGVFTGKVSAGAPLGGGHLIAIDSSVPARRFTAPILDDGSYSLNAANGVAPFLFHAQGRTESRAFDLFSASAIKGGKVNISPVTSLVVAEAAGHDCAVVACTSSTFTEARLSAAAANVQTQLVPLLVQYGLAIADEQDSKMGYPAKARKWVFFKHIAVGGYIFSRDGPLEFTKETATGNWQMVDNKLEARRAKTARHTKIYLPATGSSSFRQSLPFYEESSAYPDGATLIVVSSSSIAPAITLVYTDGGYGAARISGTAMIEAVAGTLFLPTCPRPTGQYGACMNVAQTSIGEYAVAFSDPAAAVHGQVIRQDTATEPVNYK